MGDRGSGEADREHGPSHIKGLSLRMLNDTCKVELSVQGAPALSREVEEPQRVAEPEFPECFAGDQERTSSSCLQLLLLARKNRRRCTVRLEEGG